MRTPASLHDLLVRVGGPGGPGGRGGRSPFPPGTRQRAGGGALSRRCSAPPRPAARLAPQAACIPAGHGVTEHVRGRTFSRPSACLCIDSQSRTRHQCLSGSSPTTHLTARRPGGHVGGRHDLLISFFPRDGERQNEFHGLLAPASLSRLSACPRGRSCPIGIGIAAPRQARPPSRSSHCPSANETPRFLGQGGGVRGGGADQRSWDIAQDIAQ